MKTICFTNNDLAKQFELKEGDVIKIINSVSDDYFAKVHISEIDALVIMNGNGHPMSWLIGRKWQKVEPKPQLTEQEITILKGRLAEGYEKVGRPMSIYSERDDCLGLHFDDDDTKYETGSLFQFIKDGEEYLIEELLKGQQ